MTNFFKISFRYLAYLVVAILGVLGSLYAYALSQETRQGDVHWQSCYRPNYWSWFSLPPPIALQCATLDVPLHHYAPNGKTITLALSRLPSPNAHATELLLLGGGPGQHSLDMANWLVDDEPSRQLQDNFHLIGIAQRGVRPSTAIDCGDVKEEDGAKAYVDACMAHTGKDLLSAVSSRHAVADLDIVRAKLGIDTWSMLGYSYGTKLIASYAVHHPARLRAGVLDGVVDTHEDLFTIWQNQQRSAQIAFDAFVKDCQYDCTIKPSEHANQDFLHLLATIAKKRLHDKNGEPIDEKSVLAIFEELLGEEHSWHLAHQLLSDLSLGKTDSYNEQLFIKEFGDKSFSHDAFVGINCADSAPKDRQNYLANVHAIEKIAPYNDIPQSDDEKLDACFYWAFDGDDTLNEQPSPNTPKLLFVAQQYDIATPFANAKTMAKRFNSPLVHTPRFGHTVSLSGMNACVDKAVLAYLLNPNGEHTDQLCP